MRTTISLDDDIAAAVQQLRRQTGIGLSEAVNQLVRRGLMGTESRGGRPFRQPCAPIGLRLDVSNIAEALEILESES